MAADPSSRGICVKAKDGCGTTPIVTAAMSRIPRIRLILLVFNVISPSFVCYYSVIKLLYHTCIGTVRTTWTIL